MLSHRCAQETDARYSLDHVHRHFVATPHDPLEIGCVLSQENDVRRAVARRYRRARTHSGRCAPGDAQGAGKEKTQECSGGIVRHETVRAESLNVAGLSDSTHLPRVTTKPDTSVRSRPLEPRDRQALARILDNVGNFSAAE